MAQITGDPPRIHRTWVILVALWITIWLLTLATWMVDPAGYSVGMPMSVFFVQLFGPLLVGIFLGWGKRGMWPGMKAGMIGGVLFGLANMAATLLWGLILMASGKVSPDIAMTFGEGLFEVVEFTLFYTIAGLVLGVAGGFLGALASRILRRAEA